MSDNNADSIDPVGSGPVEPDADMRRASHIPTDTPPEGVPPVVPPRPALPVQSPSTAVETDRPRTRGRWYWPTVAGAAGLVIGTVLGSTITGVIVAAQHEAAMSTFFTDAAESCDLTGVVEIEDEGRTMIVDGKGEESGSGEVDFDGLDCIIQAVGTPSAVSELMYQTRSLDGRQSGDWDDVSASWGYHPDNGLDIIFEIDD